MKQVFLPPEWHKQSAVQLTWPHINTDWSDTMADVLPVFCDIATEILESEFLIVVCRDSGKVVEQLKTAWLRKFKSAFPCSRLRVFEIKSDDTWARDHGPVSVFVEGLPVLYDFEFDGWGGKYYSENDNLITSKLYSLEAYQGNVGYEKKDFVLEGGSIDVDGGGTLMTTESCLLASGRNESLSKNEKETYLKKIFGVKNVLWVKHGYLAGDDTDGHIDMLARFCNSTTIAYVSPPENVKDEHYRELSMMEKEIKAFCNCNGKRYNCVALPMPGPVYGLSGERLPVSYANFLILNNKVLLPVYGDRKDVFAMSVLQDVFRDKRVVPVNCRVITEQHGSLHCLTMQMPEAFVL